jgi:signal transduction histidine kinase
MADQQGAVSPNDVWWDVTRLTRRRFAFDVAVALAYALIFGAVQLAASAPTAWATGALAVALAVRRVSLPVMLAAAVVAALVQVLTGEVAVAADLAYAPIAFVLGAHPSSGVRRLGLTCTVLAVVVAGLWSGLGGSDQFGSSVRAGIAVAALATVVVGGGWVAGFVRSQQRRAVQARVDAALAAAEQERLAGLYRQEQERGRIAADMHDVVAHSWAVVAAQADGARYMLPEDPARAQDALRVIGDTARAAMSDVRGLLAQLRDGELGGEVEAPAVDRVIDRMRETGLTIEHARHGLPSGGSVAEVAGYVLTESLTNALKHGDPERPVAVVEDWRDGYALHVTNALAAGAFRGSGHGLYGMSERVTSTGGHLSAGPDGRQWVVDVRIPAEVR